MASRGFTLIELLVALSVGGLVLLAAHRTLGGIADGVQALDEARLAADREGNARRLLAQVVGSIDLGGADRDADGPTGRASPARRFAGDPHMVSFPAWRRDAAGWPELRTVQLAAFGGALTVVGLGTGRIVLVDSVTALDIDYLLQRGASTRWVRRWYSESSAPEAVRLRVTRATGADTLLLIVGERG